MNKDKFLKVIAVVFALIAFLAYVDYKWYVPNASIPMLQLFWIFTAALIIIISLVYYITTKDKSESIALGITSFVLIIAGVEDLLYYAIAGIPLLNAQMPWLNNNFFINQISTGMGYAVVNGISLIASVLIGLGIVFFIDWALLKTD